MAGKKSKPLWKMTEKELEEFEDESQHCKQDKYSMCHGCGDCEKKPKASKRK